MDCIYAEANLSKCVWQGVAQALWQFNEALSMACLSSETSLYTPLAAPAHPTSQLGLDWNPEERFHTSALCAAALDNMTFPLRACSPQTTVSAGAVERQNADHLIQQLLLMSCNALLQQVAAVCMRLHVLRLLLVQHAGPPRPISNRLAVQDGPMA